MQNEANDILGSQQIMCYQRSCAYRVWCRYQPLLSIESQDFGSVQIHLRLIGERRPFHFHDFTSLTCDIGDFLFLSLLISLSHSQVTIVPLLADAVRLQHQNCIQFASKFRNQRGYRVALRCFKKRVAILVLLKRSLKNEAQVDSFAGCWNSPFHRVFQITSPKSYLSLSALYVTMPVCLPVCCRQELPSGKHWSFRHYIWMI